MALTKTQVSQLYVSIFGRASEGAGNTYWQTEVEGMSATATAMLETPAAKEYFGTALDDNQAFIETIYKNTLNKTLADDEAGIKYWVDLLESGMSRGEVVAALIDAIEDYKDSTDPKTKAAYDQFNNRVDVSDYTADTLETIAVSDIDSTLSFGGALTVTSDTATVTAAKAKVDAAAEAANKGQAFQLTDGRDFITGTDGNDTFYALAGQNQNGAIANAFATGDVIDGGAGTDTLEASLIADGTVADGKILSINGRTTNLEIAKFEVLSEHVEVDAGRMDSVKQFWSDNSDETLVINDVRLGSKLSITKDITFGMKDVDQKAGLIAAFESQSLVKAGASTVNSSLLIRVADVSTETNATPVANIDITIGFTLGGTPYVLENVQSVDGTYAGLKAAIEAALNAKGLTGLTVGFASSYTQVTAAGNLVNLPFTAQEILITDPEGKAFSGVTFEYKAIESIADQFLVVGNASAVDPTSTSSTIETNLILDNAGRGSTAGDVVIGGMSNSNIAIETLNLSVDRDSKIAELSSAYAMETTTATTKGTQVAFETIIVESLDAKGDLTIGNIFDTQKFDATSFVGENLTVTANAGNAHTNYTYNTGTSNDTLNVNYQYPTNLVDTGIAISTGAGKDVVTVNIADMTPNDYSNSVKYGNFTISTGADNDTINIKGNGDWTVDAGSGDDLVYSDNSGDKSVWTVNATNGAYTAGERETQTLTITADGADNGDETMTVTFGINNSGGTDSVLVNLATVDVTDVTAVATAVSNALTADTNFASHATASATGGVVTITYINNGPINTTVSAVAGGTVTTLAGAGTETNNGVTEVLVANIDDLNANGKGVDAILYEAKLTVAFAPKNGVTDAAAVALTNAFENTVTIATTNYIGNQVNVNDAIKAAINDDAVLSTLLSVKDGPANSLIITSLIDGANVTNDLVISIAPADYTTLTAGNAALKTGLDNAYKLLKQDSTNQLDVAKLNAEAAQFKIDSTANHVVTGANANTANSSNNTFNLGTGDDILVLSTDASSIETIVFTGSDIGDNTVVHFVTGASGDKLDFTSYLTTKVSASKSTESEKFVAVTLNVDADVEANSVTILGAFAESGTDTWAGLTAQNLLDAIKANGNSYGNLVDGTLDSVTVTNLVGQTYKSIVMIENDKNDGEYKVFELTANATDFTAATLLGTVDFGAELVGFVPADLSQHA